MGYWGCCTDEVPEEVTTSVGEANVSLGRGGQESGGVDREQLDGAMEAIRPALQADGGDIEIVEVTGDGVVRVSLAGACGTCPISASTLKAGVERILRDRVPGVREVVDVAGEQGVVIGS